MNLREVYLEYACSVYDLCTDSLPLFRVHDLCTPQDGRANAHALALRARAFEREIVGLDISNIPKDNI